MQVHEFITDNGSISQTEPIIWVTLTLTECKAEMLCDYYSLKRNNESLINQAFKSNPL